MNPQNPEVIHPLTGILKNLKDEDFSKIVEEFPAEVSVPLLTRFKDQLPKDKFVQITKNGPSLPVGETSDVNKEKIMVWYTPDQCKLKFRSRKDSGEQSNVLEVVMTMFYIALDILKAALAALITVFVPQLCPPDLVNFPQYGTSSHVCSLEENFINLEPINMVALIWNFATLFFLLLHYFILSQRESFLIEYFAGDEKVPKTHLHYTLPAYPFIETWFHFWNRLFLASSITLVIVNFINLVLSGIVVLNMYYYDYHSATTYVSNLLVLITIMYRSIEVSASGSSKTSTTAISGIQVESLQFNNIDPVHISDTQNIGDFIPWYFALFRLKGRRKNLDELAELEAKKKAAEEKESSAIIKTTPVTMAQVSPAQPVYGQPVQPGYPNQGGYPVQGAYPVQVYVPSQDNGYPGQVYAQPGQVYPGQVGYPAGNYYPPPN